MRKIFNHLASKSTHHSRLAIVFFLTLLLVSPVIGYWMYNRQMDVQESQSRELLTRIAEARAATISSFIEERLGDGRLISAGPFLRDAFALWTQQGYENNLTRQRILEWILALKKTYAYVEVAVLDVNGKILVSTEDASHRVDDMALQVIRRTIASNAVQISTIHAPPNLVGASRIIDIGAPIVRQGSRSGDAAAVLLLRF
ncbi:MAG TPA: hypothetical protein VHK70_07410, partial [Burkholderiaceae bacterium]|nr:hypothetical protein [Burkholderiaceae bacterium]